MTIWEKSVLNMQKGVQKLNVVAATFSERMKAEISIVRLRVRVDAIQTQIDELYRTIGSKVETLKNNGTLPKSTEHLLRDEDIAVSLSELLDRKRDMEDLLNEIRNEQDAFKSAAKPSEEKTA